MNSEAKELLTLVSNAITKNRKRLMWFGIISLILGTIGIFISTIITMTSVIVWGIFVIMAGVIFFIEAFSAPQWKGKLLSFLIAILYIFSGIIMVSDPMGSATWFTLFIAFFLIVMGIARAIISFQVKDQTGAWLWILLGGLLNVLLGAMIYAQWPESGLWVIGLFVSIDLMVQGMNAIILSQVADEYVENKEANSI